MSSPPLSELLTRAGLNGNVIRIDEPGTHLVTFEVKIKKLKDGYLAWCLALKKYEIEE